MNQISQYLMSIDRPPYVNGRAIKRHFGVEDQVENSNQEHTCPYKEEIHGDDKTLCNCDPEQTRECANDI